MKKIIYCSFFKKDAEALESPCYPGKLGKIIYENISKKAWIEWQKQQTILINEKKLNMINPNDRKILENEMLHFLFKK
ncbi:oxidative damage protection protein [Blochmannia endosymbiont of Polyrhachis (Hedomyrma) turneri]|uniref:oxidative damage protection protein n=1 Tax=Blochmannia endosymbiont of Polyrhachis (Hedomyrma) turneri TaxID=1505596 RepID=UPI00061A6DD1|nr:oxidative damage protection protein [Blochmannia endosymbiont of Polyrhachis (Hedomyrma) turneri]AKC59818.1 putative Fe(2+)-trafficking protein [Blochmannia endosymbiont of Polyrhachis (Hedomyrma) turneri]